MILVLGSVVAREGRIQEALAMSQEHVARSRQEPGCIAHAVHLDYDNPQRLVFVEKWVSEASLWEHFKVPASREFAKAMGELAAEPSSLEIFQTTQIAPPGRSAD